MSWCCTGGATQSFVPLNISVGTDTCCAALIEEGFVLAAAKETIVEMEVLLAAARKEQPPPMECPIIAEVFPMLEAGTEAPAPLF